MPYEKIKDIVEKFSCKLVLADPDDSKSLSCLLPVLKQLHTQCMGASLKKEAKKVVQARDVIKNGKNSDSSSFLQISGYMETFVSELLLSIQQTEKKELDKVLDMENKQDQIQEHKLDAMVDDYSDLEKKLDELNTLIAGFCPGEIPDLGMMLNTLEELINDSDKPEFKTFNQIVIACRTYVENMTLEDIYNTKPIEEGTLLLKSILSHLKKKEEFVFDCSDVLSLLKVRFLEEKENKKKVTVPGEPEPPVEHPQDLEPDAAKITSLTKILDDDMEILTDFVSEAHENLETIEVNLIDLEQDPSNTDIINDIFRPFHTIKGVSGFLSLTKINKLAHATENLLDSARSGDFLINDTATDAILESVDTLKRLIARVNQGTRTGFMPADDDIDISLLKDKLQALQAGLVSGDKEPLGKILIRKKVVDQQSLDQALEIQKDRPGKKIGEILVETQNVQPRQVAAALMDQRLMDQRLMDQRLMDQNMSKRKVDTQVKVSTQKLDDLVDYAGELVIAQSMLKQKTLHDPSLSQNVAQLGQIVTNMQTIAMSMRMIPIKATFMKMIRLVRDLSKKSGKDVNLVMKGEDTEIDRNVVDALYEPMVHMIRNSVDHGIEESSDRLGIGKPAQGEIVLHAYHKGGHIIIEIEDDGKGLDRDQILEKAKQTGLISGNEKLTDAQVYDLILQPGFSTAKQITDVSGRGVGMDVVKSGIEKFRGQLNIDSKMGEGTKFTISLPLTLAIIDGMLVRVDDERYVIPTIAIQKAFKPDKDEYFTVKGKGEMVKDRGSLIPVIRLNEIYSSSSEKRAIQDGLVVVVESKEEKRALLIDELLGKDEYVIKSLGKSLKDVEGIAGGAILADGRVGLILDIHGIFSMVSKD